MLKFKFHLTPHNSIRVNFYYDDIQKDFYNNYISQSMCYLSVWGGADKKEDKMISYELPLELEPYFKKRYPKNWEN